MKVKVRLKDGQLQEVAPDRARYWVKIGKATLVKDEPKKKKAVKKATPKKKAVVKEPKKVTKKKD